MSTIPTQNLIIDDTVDIGLTNELINGTYKTSSLTDLSKNVFTKISDLSSNVYSTLSTKESILTFSNPLLRSSNNISIDLTAYDTIALRNTALNNYLLSSTASSTYATISNLNTKQNTLTFSSPLINTSNNITIDLSAYPLKYYVDGSLNTINNTLSNKQNLITVTTPLKKDVSNNITIDLSAYPLKINVDSSLNSLNTNKQNVFTCITPLIKNDVSNNITIDLSAYVLNSSLEPLQNIWTKSSTDTNIIYNTSLANGRIGIATSAPTGALEIHSTYINFTRLKLGHYGRWAVNQLFCDTFYRFITSRTASDEIAYFGYVDSYDDPVNRTMVLGITRTALNMTGDIYASGNVGFGVSPSLTYKCNINGSVNATSYYNNGTLIDFNSYATNNNLTTNYYNKSNIDLSISTINTSLATKENILTFNAPLTRTTNTIGIDLSSYSTTATNNSTYLKLAGGSMTGTLTVPNITLGSNGKINSSDDYHYIQISQPTDTLTIQEWGKIIFSIGQTKAEIGRINSSGLTITGSISGTSFSGDGANLTNLTYGNITGRPTYFPADLSSYSTTGNDNNYLKKTGGDMTGNINMNSTSVINFGQRGDDNLIKLWTNGTDTYGFGINSYTLRYNTPANASHKFYTGTTNTATIDSLGNMIVGNANTYPNIQIGSLNGQNLGVATATGHFSSSAIAGDMVLRSLFKLILQSGGGGYALMINTNNSVSFSGNIGLGTTNPDSKIHIATPDNTATTTNIFNFKNVSDYGIYATSTSISNRGNTLDFLSRDYNLTGGANITTRNLLSLLPSGNIGIGTTNPNNIFQVGDGARLRISNNVSDYSLIGTKDVDDATNTRIVISGNSRSGAAGNIEYVATAGSHIFYTGGANEKFRIANNGNIGIGTNNPYTLLHIKGTNPSLTIMGQGNTGATSQLNLSTYDTSTNASNCSLIATDTGSYGATFQIKQKTPGADANSQFTSLFIDNTGNVAIGHTTPFSYKLYVNGNSYLNGFLKVAGIGNIHNGTPYAVTNGYMGGGSLTIGDQLVDYGGGSGWITGNTAGLMMECLNNTEIVVHDSGNRLASLMYYEGGATNKITIGRNKGWDAISLVDIKSSLTITGELKNQYWKFTNDSDGYCRLNNSAGTAYFNFAANQLYAAAGLTVLTNASIGGTLSAGNTTINGIVGINNTSPQSMLHLGNCTVANSAPVIIFGKNDNAGGIRNAFMGYTSLFYFVIGDYGNTNGTNVLTQQYGMSYAAPALSILVNDAGYVRMQYGYGQSSDERIKTNIKTIENALDKTLLLRGVEYNDIRIEPEKKKIGLIAQEVELIIPEVVRTGDDGIKSLEYQNLVGLLVEAIKEQQKQINELKNILIKNNLY